MSDTHILNLDKCNQSCIFCMKSHHIKGYKKLTLKMIMKKILRAKGEGHTRVDFYGGEPSCFDFLKEGIKFANSLGLSVTIATNAVNFSSRKFTDSFFRGIRVAGTRTSLHSYKPEIHDLITQVNGSFKKTVRGIKNILRYTSRLSVNTVINSLNYKDIPYMPKYVYSLGVRGIKFSGLILEGRAKINKWLKVNDSVYLSYLVLALRESKRLNFKLIEAEKIDPSILKENKLCFVRFLPG